MFTLKNPSQSIDIHRVDENNFSHCYAAGCMGDGCRDDCCRYGCPAETAEIVKILDFREELEKLTGKPASDWFKKRCERNPDYPSSYVRRTRVSNGYCVFHDNSGRGCLLHRLALEKGFDPHEIKPMVCFLFPLTWDAGCLHVSDFLDELPCLQGKSVIFSAQKDEIKYYLGENVARELETAALACSTLRTGDMAAGGHAPPVKEADRTHQRGQSDYTPYSH